MPFPSAALYTALASDNILPFSSTTAHPNVCAVLSIPRHSIAIPCSPPRLSLSHSRLLACGPHLSSALFGRLLRTGIPWQGRRALLPPSILQSSPLAGAGRPEARCPSCLQA